MPVCAVTALVLAVVDTAATIWAFGSLSAASAGHFDTSAVLLDWLKEPQTKSGPAIRGIVSLVITTVLVPMVGTTAAALVVADTRDLVTRGRGYYPRRAIVIAPVCITATILAAVIACTPVALITAVARTLSSQSGQAALLFLVGAPAIVWMVLATIRLSLAPQAIAMEQASPIASLRRSWTVTKSAALRVAVITIATSAVTAILGTLISTPVTALGTLAAAGQTESGQGKLLAQHFLTMSVTSLIGVIGTGVIAALLFIDVQRRTSTAWRDGGISPTS